MDRLDARHRVIAGLSRDPKVRAEVLAYTETGFDLARIDRTPALPLPDEPHLEVWRAYAREARGPGAFAYLRDKLCQLNVPIASGVSATPAYRALTRRGEAFDEASFGGRLELEHPESLRVEIHEHPAGALPVVATSHRPDFVRLWQALACRNEPVELNASVNAQMIAGLNNWDRIRRYRASWQPGPLGTWAAEMKRVAREQPALFADRLMLVLEGPYSGVEAAELGLELAGCEWLERSMRLRLEHELTHYATKRLCGVMSLKLYDELVADFMGASRALGSFRADWFQRFMGLERWPPRASGRVHTYRAGLGDEAFEIACRLALAAAGGLEQLAARHHDPSQRPRLLLALMQLSPELLAAEDREAWFAGAWDRGGALLAVPSPPARVGLAPGNSTC